MDNARSFQAGKEHPSLPPTPLLFSTLTASLSPPYPGLDFSQRRRAYSTNQITNHKPSPRAPTASDPTVPARRYPLRKAKLQDLTNQTSTDAPWWQIDLQVPEQGRLELGEIIDGERAVSCFGHKDGDGPLLLLQNECLLPRFSGSSSA